MRLNLYLAILALALAWPCWATLEAERIEDYTSVAEIPKMFPGFNPDLVNVVRLRRRRPEDEITEQQLPPEQHFHELVFVRNPAGWVLVNHDKFSGLELQPDLIARDILEHVEAIRVDPETLVPAEKVTEEFRKLNNLTEETGTFIDCRRGPQGPILAELILGVSTKLGRGDGAGIDAYFVRDKSHTKEVVLYEPQGKYWQVSMQATDWAKKAIHRFLLSEVASFSYKNELGQASLTKKPGSDATWIADQANCSTKGITAGRQGFRTDLAVLPSSPIIRLTSTRIAVTLLARGCTGRPSLLFVRLPLPPQASPYTVSA